MGVRSGDARTLLLATSMLALSQATHAFAQNATTPARAAETTTSVGEVVVTAEKRSQTLLQVPVAVSAFTSAKRDQIGIDSVQDMTNFTPGFVYDSGDDRVSIRGIGRYTNQLGADSSVGVYEDGAFETFTVKAGNDSIFVDRIEVLRGPQGTLYGRASIGGAINIISRRPTEDYYAEFRTSLDNYLGRVVEGAVSGPIVDTPLQFRLAASKTDQPNGYFNNLSGGPSQGNVRDEWYLEGQLQGKFGPHFDFWSKFFGGEWNDDGGGNAGGKITNQIIVGPDGHTPVAHPLYPFNGGAETTDPLVPSLGAFTAPGVTDVVTNNPTGLNPGNNNIRDAYTNLSQYVRLRAYYGMTLQATYHLDGADIKYIGSAQHYSYVTHEEWGEGYQLGTGVISYVDPAGNTVFPDSILRYEETHWFATNEINILSTTNSPLQWVVGAYNFNEGYKQPEEVALPGQSQLDFPISAVTGLPGPPNLHRDVVYQQGQMGAETFAVFGQTDWKFAKDWKLTTGLRYSYDEKYGDDSARLLAFGPQVAIPVPLGFDLTGVALPGAVPGVNNGLPGAERGASATVLDPVTGVAHRKLYANWGGLTAVAGVQWEPDRDTNIYAKYSRGYKSGGFNSGFGIALNPETNPESSNDYQFGVKKNFWNQLTVSLDLFYDQYYDAQIPISVASGALVSAQFYNVPEARSDGVELETTWQATKALQFIFNYGYNGTDIIKSGCIVDAMSDPLANRIGAQPGNCPGIFTNGVLTSHSQDLHGARLPNAPENKLAFNANYTFFLDPGSLSLSMSYIWRDVQYGSIFTRPYNQSPSWDQVDLRAEFRSANGRYSVILFGKNIANTTGYVSGSTAVFQTDGSFIKDFTLTPPATGGIEFQYRFF